MIEVTAAQKRAYIETAKALKGSERRRFMASVVQALGYGGQRYAERALGWNRRTVRKGMQELTSGICRIDQFSGRGRKRIEERLPGLLADLRSIVDHHRPESATPCTRHVVTGLSAADVRHRLIEEKGYSAETAPSIATIRKKLTELGYHLHPNRKSYPP